MKSIYQLIYITFLFCLTYQVNAQTDVKPTNFYRQAETTDFETIRQATEGYFEGRDKGKGSGYKQWQRWEAEHEIRLTADGQLINHAAKNFSEYRKLIRDQNNNNNRSAAINTWEEWGQNQHGNQGLPGTGVLNCVAFHPTDPNTIFTGGPSTGLWKTTNNGSSWTNLTDVFFSNVGISSILVNYNNPNIIYILTGDGDGGDTYSTGVWKTTNGGITWLPTALYWDENEFINAYKMAMNPINPDIIMAVTEDGIYATYNGGTTWEMEAAGHYYDVVYAPGTQFTIYASTASAVYRSQDAGDTWDFVQLIPLAERVQLAVSIQNDDLVYALGSGYVNWNGANGFPGLFVSNQKGAFGTWTSYSNTPAICSYATNFNYGGQFTYNIDFAVHPFDPKTIVSGAINVFRSVDTAKTWSTQGLWNDANPINQYVHSDIHSVEFNPLNNHLYIAGDGGLYHSTNNGLTYNEISVNLNINQYFDFAGTPQNTNMMIAGIYHNGSRKFTGSLVADQLGGGDGVGCMIDHQDQETLYFSSQNGSLKRSTNGGTSSISIKPNPNGKGTFVTHYAMDPTNSSIIYAGWRKDTIYKSIDKGNNWSFVEMPNIAQSREHINFVQVASNGTTVYACSYEAVFRSTNSGTSWSSIYSGGVGFTSVVPVPGAPNQALITRGGYDNDDKIYLYNDGNITNISFNLPNVPAHITAYNSNIGNGLPEMYIGTDVGVFKRNILETSWTLFTTGMPNTIIRDLEFYPDANILRASTFGRGMWQVQLNCTDILTLTEANDPTNGNPSGRLEQANSSIFSSRKIQGVSGGATYNAGGVIILQSGFLATEGNKVLIGTAGCGESLE